MCVTYCEPLNFHALFIFAIFGASKRENKGCKYCASSTVITITGNITDFYRFSKRKI